MSDHDKMLERVRALLAKAASTEFEEEAEAFRAKADELMTKYAIEMWMVEQAQAGKTGQTKPELRDMNIDWWWKMDNDLSEALWSVFSSVCTHCRCTIAVAKASYNSKTVPVVGMPADLGYADMLFTHLFMQMVDTMDPHPRPGEPLIEALVRMKEAGLKWEEIFRRLRHAGYYPENERWNPSKMDYAGKYTAYCKQHNRERVRVTPSVYRRSFATGFTSELRIRFREMRKQQESSLGSGMEVALRDISVVVREAMYDFFPDMRPHPANCQCDKCTRERNRRLPAYKPRTYSDAAIARGAKAGRDAEILSNEARLGKTPELGR